MLKIYKISSSLYISLLGLLVIASDTSNERYLPFSNNSNILPIKSAFALEPVWGRKCNSGKVIYS